jgi:hypothetical protein
MSPLRRESGNRNWQVGFREKPLKLGFDAGQKWKFRKDGSSPPRTGKTVPHALGLRVGFVKGEGP